MNKVQKIGALANKVMQEAMNSGLTWDESVAAFGVAAKAISDFASKNGDGVVESCHAHAKMRFEEGFSQLAEVVIPAQLAEAVLANAKTHLKH